MFGQVAMTGAERQAKRRTANILARTIAAEDLQAALARIEVLKREPGLREFIHLSLEEVQERIEGALEQLGEMR